MNNMDINSLMNILSKMDKKQLEEGLKKAQTILNSQNFNFSPSSNNAKSQDKNEKHNK